MSPLLSRPAASLAILPLAAWVGESACTDAAGISKSVTLTVERGQTPAIRLPVADAGQN